MDLSDDDVAVIALIRSATDRADSAGNPAGTTQRNEDGVQAVSLGRLPDLVQALVEDIAVLSRRTVSEVTARYEDFLSGL